MASTVTEAITGATTAAGCGLLALVGVFSASGLLPADRWFGLAGLGSAFALLAIANVVPRRAGPPAAAWIWRRRLTMAAAAAAALTFAFGWVVMDTRDGLWRWFGLFAASFSAMAVHCEAMIHGCREDVPVWGTRWALPSLLALALLAGALWLNALVQMFTAATPDIAMLVVVVAFLAFYLKRRYWRLADLIANAPPPPEIARHRRTAFLCLIVAPLGLTLVGMGKTPAFAIACTALAALSALGGLYAERWLFITEAARVPPPAPKPPDSD